MQILHPTYIPSIDINPSNTSFQSISGGESLIRTEIVEKITPLVDWRTRAQKRMVMIGRMEDQGTEDDGNDRMEELVKPVVPYEDIGEKDKDSELLAAATTINNQEQSIKKTNLTTIHAYYPHTVPLGFLIFFVASRQYLLKDWLIEKRGQE